MIPNIPILMKSFDKNIHVYSLPLNIFKNIVWRIHIESKIIISAVYNKSIIYTINDSNKIKVYQLIYHIYRYNSTNNYPSKS